MTNLYRSKSPNFKSLVVFPFIEDAQAYFLALPHENYTPAHFCISNSLARFRFYLSGAASPPLISG